MLRTSLALTSAALLAGMAVTGCGVRFDDGPTTIESRTVAPFQRVHVVGSADVVVRRGTERTLTVRAGEKVIDDVETRVDGDTLLVDTDSSDTLTLGGDDDATVTVTTPQLREAAVRGSGDLDVGDLDGATFATDIQGSGSVTGGGRVDDLRVTIKGSGDADLAGAAARRAVVDIAGSGDAHVTAADTLDVTVAGSGDIDYGGRPQVREHVSGSGEVSAR